MPSKLLSINQATVRYLNNTLFNNLNFTINKGEHWALIGASGSGKSALLQTIAGRFNVTGGTVEYHFFEEFLKERQNTQGHISHHKLIALVEPKHHFKNLSNTSDFYYQQRYNSSDSEDALTVDEYLSSITVATHGAVYWDFDKVIRLMRLDELRSKQLI